MSGKEKFNKKTTAESFGEIFKVFGDAISEIFDDPKLKEKAKEFADSAAESAKIFGSRFKDEDVKAKFREIGKVAQDFSRTITDCFKVEKN